MKRKSVFLVILFLFTNLFHISCELSFEEPVMVDYWPDTLLHEAVMADDLKEVERLLTEKGWKEFITSSSLYRQDPQLQQVNVNLKGWGEKTPLFYVKSLEMAQLLISKGADVLAEDRYKNTPLHNVESPAIAKLFIEKRADRHAKNDHGDTPFTLAFYFKNTELINFYDCLDKKQPEDLSDCLQ